MFIIHIALGGCLKSPPVVYGITADTGGHIAYVLEAAQAQSRLPDIDSVSIVTRLFEDERLGPAHTIKSERLNDKLCIDRVATACLSYLEKADMGADLGAFIDAFCTHLSHLPRLPDVIHAHFADAAAVAIEAQRRFGIPFVYTPHALGIDKRRQGADCPQLVSRIEAEKAAISAAGAIIVSTQDEAVRQIGGYGVPVADRVYCLPPGVPSRDPARGSDVLAAKLVDWFDRPDLPILLAIARPVRKKNLAALLRAYAGDAELRQTANLVILAGQHEHASGEERAVLDELHDLAADPALRGKVALPISHDAADVSALYKLAAKGGVFVNPALHEPFGLTLIEAAAMGVPVVATCNGGPAEIIATLGHGVLIDPRNEGAIGQACRTIVSDRAYHDRLAESGRARIGNYSWVRYAATSVSVYRAAGQPRLLASDIDNTLTGCAQSARAFSDWASGRTIPFIVATGRSFHDAQRILVQWNLPRPDAFIVDVGTCIMLKDETGQWLACPTYAAMLDKGWDRDAAERAVAQLPLDPQPVSVQTPHKISFFGNADDAASIREALANAGVAARVVYSHGRLIDVLAPAGGKANAIAAYASRLGLPLSACMAAGDSGNDADMLEQCGYAIIVANADDDLAGVPARPGLFRTRTSHAAGVLEGLARHGLAPNALQVAA